MRLLIAALAAALFFALSSMPAAAQRRPCGDRGPIVDHLLEAWGESPSYRGLDERGRLMELLVNPDTDTWTILQVFPTGVACLAAHGEGFGPAVQIPDEEVKS